MTWLESLDQRWARSRSAHPASVPIVGVRCPHPGERKGTAESKKASRQKRGVNRGSIGTRAQKEKKPVDVSVAEEMEVGKWVRTWLPRCVRDSGAPCCLRSRSACPGAVQWPSPVERRRDKKRPHKAEPEKETGRSGVDKGAAVQARWGRPATSPVGWRRGQGDRTKRIQKTAAEAGWCCPAARSCRKEEEQERAEKGKSEKATGKSDRRSGTNRKARRPRRGVAGPPPKRQ